MNKRYTALISTISNSFCDFSLDYAINKYNMYKVLATTSILAMLGQIIIGLFIGIDVTIASVPIILIYGILMFLGYFSYIKALKIMPIGLAGLMESGSLFIILAIDIFVGYLKITPRFIILFIVFIISIIIFSTETNKINEEKNRFTFKKLFNKIISAITLKNRREVIKKITTKGILLLVLSMIIYSVEPYLIKLANVAGANEIAINLGYYIFGTTYFLANFIKFKKADNEKLIFKKDTKTTLKFILLCVAIASLEVGYYVFGTMSFINDTPIIVCIIQELRVFLLVLLSVIFKTDKMTLKKLIATLLAMAAVAGLYFS